MLDNNKWPKRPSSPDDSMITQNKVFVRSLHYKKRSKSPWYTFLMILTPEELLELKDVVVIYHAHCPDGFGAAWAAYQKFGEEASYVPLKRGEELVDGLDGKEVYILDFSYQKESLLSLEHKAKKLVVIDHHKSSEEDVRSVREHVFELDHSGAYLSWQYFSPTTKVPRAIEYLSAGDIGAFDLLPDQDLLELYLTSIPHTFSSFSKAIEDFESDESLRVVHEKAVLLKDYQDRIIEVCFNSLHYVNFLGYTIPAVNATLPISETSELLRKIYTELNAPFALRYRYDDGEWKCSLRGDGTIDLSELAAKYGGGGHRGAAGFSAPATFPLPFAILVDTP